LHVLHKTVKVGLILWVCEVRAGLANDNWELLAGGAVAALGTVPVLLQSTPAQSGGKEDIFSISQPTGDLMTPKWHQQAPLTAQSRVQAGPMVGLPHTQHGCTSHSECATVCPQPLICCKAQPFTRAGSSYAYMQGPVAGLTRRVRGVWNSTLCCTQSDVPQTSLTPGSASKALSREHSLRHC
jgi:hypothetical protein